MSKIMPSDIIPQVRNVLSNASKGKGTVPCFLTAYQILDRLPSALKETLIHERTRGGKGAGVYYGAASLVSDAAEQIPEIEISYLDTKGLAIQFEQSSINPGYEVCGLYRLQP